MSDECVNPFCTRMGCAADAPGMGKCINMHCAKCGLPCNMMGHSDGCGPSIDAAWRLEHSGSLFPRRPDDPATTHFNESTGDFRA